MKMLMTEAEIAFLQNMLTDGEDAPPPALEAGSSEGWVMLTKRTEDPKLAYLEGMLAARGIPTRRAGYSFHAPILEVPEECAIAAEEMLTDEIDGRMLDAIPDDDPMFGVACLASEDEWWDE